MSKETLEILLNRKSIKKYDSSYELTQDDIRQLLTYTTQAPSAWNLQHWKFIVIHSQEAKEQLLPLAYYQSQVVESSATIIILGDLKAYENAEATFQHIAGTDIYDKLLSQIHTSYDNDNYAIEAAFHNTAYAAMQLMIAAEAMGLSTNALGGFDKQGLINTYHIDSEKYVPTVLITVGKKAQDGRTSSRFNINTQIIDFK